MHHLSEETLNEYLDQALVPKLHAETKAHLAACPDCTLRLANLRALFAELDVLPDLPLEVDFTPAILTRLEQNSPLPRPFRWLTIIQALGVLFAVVLSFPLAETFIQGLNLPLSSTFFVDQTTSWLKIFANWRIPLIIIELPSLNLNLSSTTLILAILSVSLLWLSANGLLLIPRSRRNS